MAVLQDRVAIVTGASSGIGWAAAKLFAEKGARVVVGTRRQSALDELVREIEACGGQAVALPGDVRDEDYAKALAELAMKRFGGLDVAFNNAGINGTLGPATDLSLSAWRETLDTNLTSAFLGATHQIPALLARGGGALIFTSSFVGNSAGIPGTAAYAASKAGMAGLVRTLAIEYAAHGIRVNALLPGGVDTPSNHANLPGAAPETREWVEGLHAMKRMAQPEEIARAALYLASDAASFVTGAALPIDGGVSINLT